MRQQFTDPARGMRRQTREYVLQIGIRIVTIEFGRLHQRHHSGRPFACTQGSREQPIIPAHRNRPDLPFDVIVIDRQLSIVQIARKRTPAFKAVIEGFGGG